MARYVMKTAQVDAYPIDHIKHDETADKLVLTSSEQGAPVLAISSDEIPVTPAVNDYIVVDGLGDRHFVCAKIFLASFIAFTLTSLALHPIFYGS